MTPPDEWRRRLLTSAVKAGRSPMVLALFIAGALVTVLMITVVSPLVAPDDKTSRAQGVRAPAGAAVSLPPSPTTEPAERPATATPTVRLISPPTATVTPRPTEGPSPTATPRRTPTPRPTATPTVVPFIVSHLSNPEARVKLRTEPSPDSDPPILILEPRTPLQFLGDTKTDYEGILWILVRTAEGAVGWVREISTIPAA